MPTVRLTSLTFDHVPFRKLRNLTVPFAERITIIAGHNGIGKSTILGLIANGSGLSGKKHLSYFGRTFQGNLAEIIHIDFEREYEYRKKAGEDLPAPSLSYDVNGHVLLKRCTITGRTQLRRVRVVPRNEPHEEATFGESFSVGPDAKVPLPTIYLGMTRMLPVGESDPDSVESSVDKGIPAEDAALIKTFTDSVIASHSKDGHEITTQAIKGTRKTAKHTEYSYSSRCISLGQDSLGAIATAVASFARLKREWPEYPGGLLVIDEVDAGFHPRAQQKLIDALGNAAKRLNLQVVATTHSVPLIEAVHPEARARSEKAKVVDSVVYLTDTARPHLASTYSLDDVRRDMSLVAIEAPARARNPSIEVYLEDAEAGLMLKHLLGQRLKRRITREVGCSLKPVALNLGCENLKSLYTIDSHFRTVVIALDADSPLPANAKNFVSLPGTAVKGGMGLSPERSLHRFLQELVASEDAYPATWAKLRRARVTSDYINEHLLDTNVNISNRESAKKWMTAKSEQIANLQLIQSWLAEHPTQVAAFEEALVEAAKVAMRARSV